MLRFLEYLREHRGWLWDKDHITLYHGSHKNNISSIKKNGLNKKDPNTGMISLTPDPHTAHGYAAMSGEHNFRAAGAKAKTVPSEDRRVVKFKIPKKCAKEHMDSSYSGNIGKAKSRIQDKNEYHKWKKENPGKHDSEYYQTSELRFKRSIPHHFIVGVLRKK